MLTHARHMITRFAAVISIGWVASASFAHVFWIQPLAFQAAANDLVKVKLRVGDTFPGDVMPRANERIVEFVSIGPDNTKHDLVGRDGAETAGIARFPTAGLYVLSYVSTPASVTLEPAKFESYLKEKGLEKIIDQRTREGTSAEPVKENYARCAKSIMTVGDGANHTGFDRKVGSRLEIVPRSNPAGSHAGDTLAVEVLFDSRPLAGALIEARNPAAPAAKVSARTDDHGLATLKLASNGVWVFDTVEMVKAPKESGADWESFWASLTFEMTPRD